MTSQELGGCGVYENVSRHWGAGSLSAGPGPTSSGSSKGEFSLLL